MQNALAAKRIVLASALLLPACFLWGCGADEVVSAGEMGLSDRLGSTEQAVIIGNWTSSNLYNGDGGPSPFLSSPWGGVICQAWDYRDQTWHPGKLHMGTCRYEWGWKAVFASSYRALQNAYPSYRLQWNPGYTPYNAVASDSGLPVCQYDAGGGSWTSGKVWMGQCLSEYANVANMAQSNGTAFFFLVQ